MVAGSNGVLLQHAVVDDLLEREAVELELVLGSFGGGELVVLHLVELAIPVVARAKRDDLWDVRFRLDGEEALRHAEDGDRASRVGLLVHGFESALDV